MVNSSPYPIVDLFAGPGGLGEGFAAYTDAGLSRFKSVVSVERDVHAHATLLLRHFFRNFEQGKVPKAYYQYIAGQMELSELQKKYPDEWRHAELSALNIELGPENHETIAKAIKGHLSKSAKWALVGGPPCQAYSLVGRSRRANDPEFEKDEKHFLYREYLKIIVDHRPPVFVMENVKGLLSAKVDGVSVVQKILEDLAHPRLAISDDKNGLSYKLYALTEEGERLPGDSAKPFIVQADDFGVPQARHRMFIIGVRSDLDVQPGSLKKKKAPSINEIIDDLPAIRSGISKEKDSSAIWAGAIWEATKQSWAENYSFKEIFGTDGQEQFKAKLPTGRFSKNVTKPEKLKKWYGDKKLISMSCHEARSHMRSDLHRYFFAALHAKLTGSSPKLSDFPESLLPNHKNVEDGKRGKMFSDRFRVQLPDKVATTVTSHISKDGHYFIHPDPLQCRSLTVREAARLQTFPDNYHFEGPRTQQYHQVGNAVPPLLAVQIANIIAKLLDEMPE